jgi:hypothetical protein
MPQRLLYTYLNDNPRNSKSTISINSFDQISLQTPHPLVLCDIDETLLITDAGHYNATPTDYHGFMRLVQRVRDLGGELKFLTARSKMGEYYTRIHFNQIGIDYNQFKVHYTNAGPKGKYILENIPLRGYNEVIFIDDNDGFIHSVKSHHPEIQCYKFHIPYTK